MATRQADTVTAPSFSSLLTAHYYAFSTASPHWRVFDISGCLPPGGRLYLRLNLAVSYSQLIQFSLMSAQVGHTQYIDVCQQLSLDLPIKALH